MRQTSLGNTNPNFGNFALPTPQLRPPVGRFSRRTSATVSQNPEVYCSNRANDPGLSY
ncbi:hypothetical protein HJG54_09025 [Leptolyngbya sp. NK1-12]|uniref:Uncharacterized protein n=1 Tax=Leptolyngbya sp. NK1-12 TaxID=2547451 RepID=A0AA96WD95_9CYAN|nr:hypothetical protein [Leptolyngbya sp. NK1-12]WNZ22989.1 hypothetical protein HJG54_09025 [Leptolyngbya sp. NK1-12]